MKKTARESLDAYYREAQSWANDRQDALRASRRVAWIVATVAVVVAVLEACALLFLAPLKTVVPYTLLVDKNTGYVQALKPLDADRIAPDTALTQSFLVQYVVAREGFDADALQANYRKVVLWSAEGAREGYINGIQVSNPNSPLARLPRSSVIETRAKSVSPLDKDSAMVRFETQRRDAGGQAAPARSWVAVIRYRFSSQPMSTEDRYLNPLGFQVTRYRIDPESAPPAQAEDVPPAAPAAVPVAPPATGAAPQPAQATPQGVELTL